MKQDQPNKFNNQSHNHNIRVNNQIYKKENLQNMSDIGQVHHKLRQITTKFKLLCQSYKKIKQQLAKKDQRIQHLERQLAQAMQRRERVDNQQFQSVRLKYQHEDKQKFIQQVALSLQPTHLSQENYRTNDVVSKLNVKSLNSYDFLKARKIQEKQQLRPNNRNQQNYTKKQNLQQKEGTQQKSDFSSIKYAEKQSLRGFLAPSQIELKKKQEREKKISEIDKKYTKQLNINNNEQQSQILKELWEERDKQIKRMDELFQNLNKKIYGD